MSKISEATQNDWEDFWYCPEKFGSWHVNDSKKESMKKILSNPKEKIKSITNCEMLC